MLKKFKRIAKKVGTWILIALLASLVVFEVVSSFFREPYEIKGPSMYKEKSIEEQIKNEVSSNKEEESTPAENKQEEHQEASKEVTEEHTEPSGIIMFDDVTYETFSNEDEALRHTLGLPGSIVCGCKVTGVPGENTARMRIWVDYSSSGKFQPLERALYSDNNWSDTIDLSGFSGQTIVLAISRMTGNLIPMATYEYIALEIPESPMAAEETTETSEEESSDAEETQAEDEPSDTEKS